MFALRRLAIAAAALCLFSAPARAQVILLQDNFNAENGGNPTLNFFNLQNFMVTQGSVDLIGNGFFDFYPGNGLYLDLDGSTGQGGTIQSRALFNLDPGTYTLSFDLGNNLDFVGNTAPNLVDVSLGSAFMETFTRAGITPLETFTRTFTVDAPLQARLVFRQQGGDNQGAVLDNVLLVQQIPEPGTLALWGVAGAGLLGYVRRRLGSRA